MGPILLLAALLGCDDGGRPVPADEPAPAAPVRSFVAQAPPPGTRLAAVEIRVAWQGARAAPPGVHRTEEEARDRALALHARAAAGEDARALAREASDAPSAARGGGLGPFETPLLDPALEAALAAVAPGEVTALVRSPAGYHVLVRAPTEPPGAP